MEWETERKPDKGVNREKAKLRGRQRESQIEWETERKPYRGGDREKVRWRGRQREIQIKGR